MNVSVVVCTRGRRQSLAKTLTSVASSQLPAWMDWEVVVVGNNRSDQTEAIVGEANRQSPGRFQYAEESQQGFAFALNAGIRAARGEILVFTHDDVAVEPAWLQNLTARLLEGKWVGAAGRVEMEWPSSLPKWLSLGGPVPRHGLPAFDLGPNTEVLPCPPPSSNMAFRKALFQKYGYFETRTGSADCDNPLLARPEIEFGRRLLSAKVPLRYERSAVVHHPVAEAKLSKEYLLASAFERGRLDARQYPILSPRMGLSSAIWTLRWMLTQTPPERFYRKLTVWEKRGTFSELRQMAREEKDLRRREAVEIRRNAEEIKKDHGNRLDLKAGEWVEVRSEREILATLDDRARLGNMPFMTEMLQYCGKQFRVHRRTDKTCDNIEPWSIRRLTNSVLLEGVRCGGEGHGGCQAGCMIFWKEAWLKRVGDGVTSDAGRTRTGSGNCTVETIVDASLRTEAQGNLVYSCQATEVLTFTSHMSSWDPRQYVRDLRSCNLSTGLAENSRWGRALETVLGVQRILRSITLSIYNTIQERRPGKPIYPFLGGNAQKTPIELLNLQPGELVQIRGRAEIVATLDKKDRNRGLLFDGAMLTYCGGIYRVLRRVHRIIDEKTGKMLEMKSPCIALEGVTCRWDYHRLCPRDTCTPYWREGWLKRVVPHGQLSEEVSETCEHGDKR